ncbi:MAG: TetR/AcrR family transcriptional regulator, partial [Elusimicrobia bacterium]|nr:TetR/AcrR family transcriptional regulator [Elusimicrobiota bacterium]
MTRPSTDTEKRLLDAGRKLLYRNGLSGLRVRMVAREAGVNLGMFHYHFGSLDNFVKVLLRESYKGFLSRLSLDVSPGRPPRERLRSALTSLGLFIRDNRLPASALILDALSGNGKAADFIAENFTAHVGMLVALLEECKKTGVIADLPIPLLVVTVGSSLAAPALAVSGMEKAGVKKPLGITTLPELHRILLSDQAVKLRV